MTEPVTVDMDLAKLTKAHLNIRNARAGLREDYEKSDKELKEAQERLEAAMLDHLNRHNMDSVRTEHGTFYRQIDIKPSCSDWSAFYDWVKQHDAFDALERRIKKTFITEFMEAHQGQLPPGVSVIREWAMRVRKAS